MAPTPPPHLSKILVIKLRALGDTVLMTAALDELRQAYPNARIDVAVQAPWAGLMGTRKDLGHVWSLTPRRDVASRSRAVAALALKIRRENYDCVINLHASPSSSLLSFASGAKLRSVHFHGHHDKNRYSTVVVPGKGQVKPNIERDMDALRALGLTIAPGRLPRVEVAEPVQLDPARPILGLGLGASRPSKCWEMDRFASLAVLWCLRRSGFATAIIGPGEESLGHQFLKKIDDALRDELPDPQIRSKVRERISVEFPGLPERLAEKLAPMSVFVGNDSGPRHLALAVGVPTVTLFGPEDPYEWHPYPQDRHPILFIEGLPCRADAAAGQPAWCGLKTCIQERHRCMSQIGVEAVLEQTLRVAQS